VGTWRGGYAEGGETRDYPRMIIGTLRTDQKLYRNFKLTKNEIDFIESKVRPMETNNE